MQPLPANPLPPCTPPKEIKLIGAYSDPYDSIEKRDFDCRLYPKPIQGFSKHIGADSDQIFPNCCSFHRELYSLARLWYEKFPECCDHHKQMAQSHWFKKEDFQFLPEKIVLQVSQTEHLISARINEDSWHEDIVGYIDHNFLCFGLYGIGLNLYLYGVEKYIDEDARKFNIEKASKLKEHLNYVATNYKYDVVNTHDWDYQHPIIKRWIELFPFDMSYFKGLKQQYTTFSIPAPFDINQKKHILTGVHYGLDENLWVDLAHNLTIYFLKTCSSFSLLERGILKDVEKAMFELYLHQRKLELQQLYHGGQAAENDRYYNGILEKWYDDELKFINKIAPLILKRKELLDAPKPPTAELLEVLVLIDIKEGKPSGYSSPTRRKIDDYFSRMKGRWAKGWEYAFLSIEDYDLFASIVESYFTQEPYDIPSTPIKLKQKTKSQVAEAIGSLYLELGEDLTRDTNFYQIVRILNLFSESSDENLYDNLTRSRSPL